MKSTDFLGKLSTIRSPTKYSHFHTHTHTHIFKPNALHWLLGQLVSIQRIHTDIYFHFFLRFRFHCCWSLFGLVANGVSLCDFLYCFMCAKEYLQISCDTSKRFDSAMHSTHIQTYIHIANTSFNVQRKFSTFNSLRIRFNICFSSFSLALNSVSMSRQQGPLIEW